MSSDWKLNANSTYQSVSFLLILRIIRENSENQIKDNEVFNNVEWRNSWIFEVQNFEWGKNVIRK